MNKKRRKFKKRHKFSLAESMPSDKRIRDNLIFGIARAFPDEVDREKYMEDLLRSL